MPNFKENYIAAIDEFEKLTNKRAPILKSKGKEKGVKQLTDLFKKTAKPVEQLCENFDKLYDECTRAKSDTALKAAKNYADAYDKLNVALKKNIVDLEPQLKELGPDDKDLKTGFDVLIKRLEQMRKMGKSLVVQQTQILKETAGKEVGLDEKLKNNIKITYLGIKKGCDETEALMKVFIAKPTVDHLVDAFSSSTGPRSIQVAVTAWKQLVLKKDPSLKDKLQADPEHLIKKIYELGQQKGKDYWAGVLKMNQPGWEDRAKKVALECLKQVELWRRMAEEIKGLLK